jgi:hypothetical protein
MTSQVFFFSLWYVYGLTDHKFMSLFIWTGEWVIDRFDSPTRCIWPLFTFNLNSTWLYFVSLRYTIIMFISEQIISVVDNFNYRIRDMWALKCASTKFYSSALVFFTNADWQEPLECLRHPTDISGHHDDRNESILFIWYLIDWSMSATFQWTRDIRGVLVSKKVIGPFANVIVILIAIWQNK